jgi:hypothetical protein
MRFVPHRILRGLPFKMCVIDRFVTQPKSLNDDKAHEQCGDAGNGEVRRLIAADILRDT